jgi:hypothetical protein
MSSSKRLLSKGQIDDLKLKLHTYVVEQAEGHYIESQYPGEISVKPDPKGSRYYLVSVQGMSQSELDRLCGVASVASVARPKTTPKGR